MKKVITASLKLYANHFITLLLISVMIPLFATAQNKPQLFSAITGIIYIAIAYGVAWNVGKRDARGIEGFHPSWRVPAAISLLSSVVPVVLFVLCITMPELWKSDVPFLAGEVDFFIKGFRFENTVDCIFRLWYVHFASFIPNGNKLAYFGVMLILPVIVFAGYAVGLKKFRLTELLFTKLVFVSKKENSMNK